MRVGACQSGRPIIQVTVVSRETLNVPHSRGTNACPPAGRAYLSSQGSLILPIPISMQEEESAAALERAAEVTQPQLSVDAVPVSVACQAHPRLPCWPRLDPLVQAGTE